ncbi:MAG: threonine/serine dehydratase [Candidatus Promineifilaceae bacterium]
MLLEDKGFSMEEAPTFQEILKARAVLGRYLPKTPLFHYPTLDMLIGAEVYVKHENYQPVGVFKVRGGVNLLASLPQEERDRGVITASTGNHGQSVAFAANLFQIDARIVVPKQANPVKVEAIESLGARIIYHGNDFDEAKDYASDLAVRRGYRFISPGDEPLLIAGVATYSLEILEDCPDIDVIIVPVGAGSGASGACLVAKTVNPKIRVIAVQAEKAPSAYLTWKNRKATDAKMETDAEGLATRTPFMIPQKILWKYLDDFILVTDDEMRSAVRIYLERAKTLAELAGAAPLAAAMKTKDELAGKKVALVLSGGNISPGKLVACLR